MFQKITKIVDKTQEKKKKPQIELVEMQDEKNKKDIKIQSPELKYLIDCEAEIPPTQKERKNLY